MSNKVTPALCDMYDLKRSIPKNIKKLPKDNEGTQYTIGECIDDVIDFLESLDNE